MQGCGLQPIGNKSIVTKAYGTVLYEINDKPALEFYRRYLGDRLPSPENALAIYEQDSEYSYIRVLNSCDSETGSINFLCNIPEQALRTGIFRKKFSKNLSINAYLSRAN